MGMEVSPITATLGAEISGVDIADIDGVTLEDLKKAWLDYKVLVLRDQHITTEEHIAFGRLFGDLEVHPFTDNDEDHPEVVVLEAGGASGKTFVAAGWHSDVTWRAEPSMGSILRGRIVPPVGGDTCFADATAAYQRLSDGWKQRVDDLHAIHDYSRVFADRVKPSETDKIRAQYPPQRHPVIRTHPVTGARGIYTNIGFTSHIDGVSEEESLEILRHLERAIWNPSVQCRVRWDVDTFVMWDNRCVQHAATADFLPEHRLMERVTIVGDRPF
ncbi:MAG: TauD/TfdA family dioxygenase [Acidimicrobiaceae bacterium]|nr:TauD/TfdA family dioxygenase [Acidimicrobiaceae bacterium]